MQTELDLADRGFVELLDHWPSPMRECLNGLERRVWGNDKRGPTCAHRFNLLTRLYPAMQVQGVLPCTPERLKNTLVAHVCLVLCAYIEDKADDGQVLFDEQDRRVVRRFFDDAVGLLGELKTDGALIPELRSVFVEAGWDDSEFGMGEREARIVEAADFSARLGFLATACLLAYGGMPIDTIRRAADAYRHTVIALQYSDDMLDWREDLTIGDKNLLLGAVADRGVQLPGVSSSEWEHLNAAHAFLRFDMFNFAAARAHAHLRKAIAIQNDLGSAVLATRLSTSGGEINALAPRLLRKIENEVLVGFLLAPLACQG